MKKLLTFAVALFAAFSLTSCGSSDDPEAAKMLTEFEQMIDDLDKMEVDKTDISSMMEIAEKTKAIGEKVQGFTERKDDMSRSQVNKLAELTKKFTEVSQKKAAELQ